MKISNKTYLVGSGETGVGISHKLDCNIYLVDGGEECALIDAGSGLDPNRIITNIKQDGIKIDNIKYILLTHIHGDHAAGAAHFAKKFNIKLILSKEAVAWYESGDMDKTSINQAIDAGIYPPDFRYPVSIIDQSVAEGDKIQVGDIELEVINTPGHSKGHIAFLWRDKGINRLFSGDLVFAGGKVVIQNIWDCEINSYANSMNKVKKLNIDELFPGHGPFILSNASSHIDRACEYFNRLTVPPNL